MILRAGRDEDAAEFIDLIGACWAEYPGVGLLVDEEVPELRALASYFAAAGGALWVHEVDGRVAAMAGVKPVGGGVWELCKVYARPALRGTGVAQALVSAAEDFARAAGGAEMVLWSDTNFDRAHRFYEKCGYVRHGGIRALEDASRTLEFGYMKPLSGVRVMALDVAAAGSAVPVLASVLRACVAEGAHLGFLAPLEMAAASAYFRGVAKRVALGECVLLAAWCDGVLAGSVQVEFDLPENQRHLVEIQKLMVRASARRRGVARRLMAAAEDVVQAAGRRMMVLDCRAGDAGEALFGALGFGEVGRIGGGLVDGDVVIFRKLVGLNLASAGVG